jgi:hypothetical protein
MAPTGVANARFVRIRGPGRRVAGACLHSCGHYLTDALRLKLRLWPGGGVPLLVQAGIDLQQAQGQVGPHPVFVMPQVQPGELLDASQPVPQGFVMDEQALRRGPLRAVGVEEGAQRAQQRAVVPAVVVDQRPGDLPDERLQVRRVARAEQQPGDTEFLVQVDAIPAEPVRRGQRRLGLVESAR